MTCGNYLYEKRFSPCPTSVSSILTSENAYSKLLSISHAPKLLAQPIQLQTFIHFQKNHKKVRKICNGLKNISYVKNIMV